MPIEQVMHPMGGVQERDLTKPEQLELATVNQFDLDESLLLERLGFRPELYVGNMVHTRTPGTIMGRQWGLYYQDESTDPHLFTVCLQLGPVYTQLFRQNPHPSREGKYCIVTL